MTTGSRGGKQKWPLVGGEAESHAARTVWPQGGVQNGGLGGSQTPSLFKTERYRKVGSKRTGKSFQRNGRGDRGVQRGPRPSLPAACSSDSGAWLAVTSEAGAGKADGSLHALSAAVLVWTQPRACAGQASPPPRPTLRPPARHPVPTSGPPQGFPCLRGLGE